MSSTSLIDLDRLLAPIPGDDPAGHPVPFVLRTKLDAARKAVNPSDYAANDPLRPAEAKPADWPEIVRLTQDVLAEQSKDLMTAARLTEALTKLHGFVGLRDGLTLLRRLIEDAWDRLSPPIEDGDLDVRAAPFNWLDDPDRGARFPSAVRAVPLVEYGEQPISWLDWKASQSAPAAAPADQFSSAPPAEPFAEKFDKAVAAADRPRCQAQVDDLAAGLAELETLSKALDDRLQDSAPGMADLRKAMADCLDLARRILDKKGPAPVEYTPPADEPTAAPAAGEAAPAANGAPRPAAAPRLLTRDDAYQQLASAAALLQRLEPHSPIPFMVQRAVALGQLPFPELMKVMIRDPGVIEQLSRELGIETPNQ